MKTLFESKQTPRLSGFLIASIETDEQEIGTNRQRHRPSHPIRIPSHLHPAQMQATLELFYGDLDSPAPGIQAQHRTRFGFLEIGHKESHLIRPCVTPFFR